MKLMMFGAPWCQACKTCKPFAMEAAKEENCEFEYIDSDEDSDKVAEYGVRHAPTFVAENGDKREYLTDFRNTDDLVELIQSVK